MAKADIKTRVDDILAVPSSPSSPTAIRPSCRAASSSASRWLAPWWWSRKRAARRAALQPRRKSPGGDALRDPAGTTVSLHHHLRHARPGGGHDRRRRDRGHEPGPDRTGPAAPKRSTNGPFGVRRALHRWHQHHPRTARRRCGRGLERHRPDLRQRRVRRRRADGGVDPAPRCPHLDEAPPRAPETGPRERWHGRSSGIPPRTTSSTSSTANPSGPSRRRTSPSQRTAGLAALPAGVLRALAQ